jgi:membrane protease subunit HflC
MKRNPITLVTGGVLAVIFALMLFTFQVRQTEVAVVTTFGKYSRSITNAGFNLRLPWPIQKVYAFDNRIQTFERKFEETPTADGINILITVYAGWRVAYPQKYLEAVYGDPVSAEKALEGPIRGIKTGVISQHVFADLISTNQAEIKFDEIEKEMLHRIQAETTNTLGVQIEFLGIKQLGLPESITAKVFDRMKSERNKIAAKYKSEGDATNKIIRAEANSQANKIVTEATAEAIHTSGLAEAEAAKWYQVFATNQAFANFILKRNALADSLKEKTTFILDQQTSPLDLLRGDTGNGATNAPAK